MDVLKVAPSKEEISKISVIIDRLTKHFEVATLINETESEISKMFLRTWVHRFGLPCVLILDRARAHLSTEFTEMARVMNIKLQFTVPMHPQANAQIERLHSSILTSLRMCRLEYPDKSWTEFLSHIRWSHDISVQTHGSSPYELLFRLEPMLSSYFRADPPLLDDVDPQWIQLNIWPDLAYMRSAARRNARIAAENLKKCYDSRNKAKYRDFAPRD